MAKSERHKINALILLFLDKNQERLSKHTLGKGHSACLTSWGLEVGVLPRWEETEAGGSTPHKGKPQQLLFRKGKNKGGDKMA